ERRRLVIEALEEELRKQREEVALQANKIRDLEDKAYSMQSSELQLAALDTSIIDPPLIEIIEPPMSLTRGRPTVKLRSSARNQEIIGKVEAAAGLATFKVNDQTQDVDKHNLFWVDVPIYKEDTPIEIVAVDNQGRRVTVDFSFITDRVIAQQPVVEKPQIAVSGDMGKYYALVIGNNNYAHFPKLDTAINDAHATAKLLRERYGYETTTVIDADRYALLSAFNKLREKLTDKDNLLVYYAGHGELDRVNERGYWLPIDAEPGNTANWISNIAITDIINALPAKHVMVVADSCYAGTMSSASMARLDLNLPADVKSEWVSVMSETRARTVLTSGGIAPVLDGGGGDHSVFAKAFLKVLSDANGLMEGHSVYRQVLT
ncbi:MAG: caspase family protein, partial [Sneathiellales bacterium]|nr:caspase family protein [Sneathiellales bacterium]